MLDAAVEVLTEQGERAIRVRDIAARAGVTEPSLYHFFGSREGLIADAQVHRFVLEQVPQLEAYRDAAVACRDAGQFLAVTRAAVAGVCEPWRKRLRFTRMNVLGSAESRPDLEQRLAIAQRPVTALAAEPLQFAQRHGWIRADLDCLVLAAWVLGQINGRLLIEIDPEWTDEQRAAWDRIAIDSLICVLTDTSSVEGSR